MTRQEFKQALNRYVLYKQKEEEARTNLKIIEAECNRLENQLADLIVPNVEAPAKPKEEPQPELQPEPEAEEPKDDPAVETSTAKESAEVVVSEESKVPVKEAPKKNGNRKLVKMYNYFTREEKTFDTMTDAALFLNTNPQSLSTLLKTRARIGDWVVEKEKK